MRQDYLSTSYLNQKYEKWAYGMTDDIMLIAQLHVSLHVQLVSKANKHVYIYVEYIRCSDILYLVWWKRKYMHLKIQSVLYNQM